MAQRDLTYNSGRISHPKSRGNQSEQESEVEPPQFENIFNSTESSSFERSSTPFSEDNSRPYNVIYSSNYYPDNNSDTHLLREQEVSTPRNLELRGTQEYNRYPSIQGSRIASFSSLNNLYQKVNNSDNTSSSQSNNTTKGINQYHSDFSPFGGYPASAFPLTIDQKEGDDYLHNPDPINDSLYDKNRFLHDLKNMDKRSMGGLFGFIALFIAAGAVFILLPVLTYANVHHVVVTQAYEVLTNYNYPMLSAIRTSLVDPDTPPEYRQIQAKDGSNWSLVFSDEFNAEGRTFYPGDDQFFEAPDLHYAATKDLEWYDPDAVITSEGTLNLRMDAFKNHDLYYRSGMVQSWNKFCFTQGRIEFSARLPNYGNVSGLWPGMWTMGNIGRPGYLATTDGVWPYSYNSCDTGITANQSSPDGISYLPGQRLNSCTCPGEAHPNPGVGRGAPEIDALEAEVGKLYNGNGIGVASQSFQIAPFDIWYMPDYDWIEIHNKSVTTMNTYAGGPFQQAVSGTTTLNTSWYEFGDTEHNFQKYGFEFLNDIKTGYCQWFVGDNPTFTLYSQALHPNGNIGWRLISREPMSIIMNLGISNNWAYIDWASIVFPVTMRIDYVRVYQPPNQINIGCDPPGFPTQNYIQSHLDLYYNMNLTNFTGAGYTMPKSSFLKQC